MSNFGNCNYVSSISKCDREPFCCIEANLFNSKYQRQAVTTKTTNINRDVILETCHLKEIVWLLQL